MAITTISTNSIGVVILVKRSMPFLIPPITITAVATRKTTYMTSGSTVAVAILPNTTEAPSGLPCERCPESERTRKSSDHPPTTQ